MFLIDVDATASEQSNYFLALALHCPLQEKPSKSYCTYHWHMHADSESMSHGTKVGRRKRIKCGTDMFDQRVSRGHRCVVWLDLIRIDMIDIIIDV